MVEMIADVLLVAGALGAGVYCYVLARRLSRFNDLETGVGGAVAVLSAQVDDLIRTLQAAQSAAQGSSRSLEDLTGRAETVSRKLELLVASMHDIPDQPPQAPCQEAEDAPPAPVFSRHSRDAGRAQ